MSNWFSFIICEQKNASKQEVQEEPNCTYFVQLKSDSDAELAILLIVVVTKTITRVYEMSDCQSFRF